MMSNPGNVHTAVNRVTANGFSAETWIVLGQDVLRAFTTVKYILHCLCRLPYLFLFPTISSVNSFPLRSALFDVITPLKRLKLEITSRCSTVWWKRSAGNPNLVGFLRRKIVKHCSRTLRHWIRPDSLRRESSRGG